MLKQFRCKWFLNYCISLQPYPLAMPNDWEPPHVGCSTLIWKKCFPLLIPSTTTTHWDNKKRLIQSQTKKEAFCGICTTHFTVFFKTRRHCIVYTSRCPYSKIACATASGSKPVSAQFDGMMPLMVVPSPSAPERREERRERDFRLSTKVKWTQAFWDIVRV